jgi:hypothetical protein
LGAVEEFSPGSFQPSALSFMQIAVQQTSNTPAECPKCKNRDGIRDGGPSLSGHRAYDIYSDTFGLLRCPRCRFKGLYADFHQPKQGTK